MTLDIEGLRQTVDVVRVTPGFFKTAGVKPFVGRLFSNDEYRMPQAVVILSYPAWTRNFQGDPNVIGKPVSLNGRDYTVLAVLPPSFHTPSYAEFLLATLIS